MGMFGLTTPLSYGTPGLGLQGASISPLGLSPFQTQQPLGLNNPLAQGGFGMTTPFQTPYGQPGIGQPGIGGSSQLLQQVLPQIVQILQTLPVQIQQVLQLQQIQLQQLQQLQQIVQQVIPAQLQQLQQLIQYVPQQIQQLQQTAQPIQPFGLGGFTPPSPWGVTPQAFGAQAHVM